MQINASMGYPTAAHVSSMTQAKPNKPAAPTPPAGGNVENRQPPPEPQTSGATVDGVTSSLRLLDTYA